jgi:hypothetical protein
VPAEPPSSAAASASVSKILFIPIAPRFEPPQAMNQAETIFTTGQDKRHIYREHSSVTSEPHRHAKLHQ